MELKEAIQEHINNCKSAVLSAMKGSNPDEIRISLQELDAAEKMSPEHPEAFFDFQRNMFLCSSI